MRANPSFDIRVNWAFVYLWLGARIWYRPILCWQHLALNNLNGWLIQFHGSLCVLLRAYKFEDYIFSSFSTLGLFVRSWLKVVISPEYQNVKLADSQRRRCGLQPQPQLMSKPLRTADPLQPLRQPAVNCESHCRSHRRCLHAGRVGPASGAHGLLQQLP